MPACIPHPTGGGACRPGANSKGLSTASWWVNHPSLHTDLLQVQTHKCDTWVGQTVRILTFRQGGKRSDMKSRRFKQGDVNVDSVRIILNRAPYTCLATANDQATITRDFVELRQRIEAALTATGSSRLVDLDDSNSACWKSVRAVCERVAMEMVREHLHSHPSICTHAQLTDVENTWARADEWRDALQLRRLEEAIAPLREYARSLYSDTKSSAYNHWTAENLKLQYLLSCAAHVQDRTLDHMRSV